MAAAEATGIANVSCTREILDGMMDEGGRGGDLTQGDPPLVSKEPTLPPQAVACGGDVPARPWLRLCMPRRTERGWCACAPRPPFVPVRLEAPERAMSPLRVL